MIHSPLVMQLVSNPTYIEAIPLITALYLYQSIGQIRICSREEGLIYSGHILSYSIFPKNLGTSSRSLDTAQEDW